MLFGLKFGPNQQNFINVGSANNLSKILGLLPPRAFDPRYFLFAICFWYLPPEGEGSESASPQPILLITEGCFIFILTKELFEIFFWTPTSQGPKISNYKMDPNWYLMTQYFNCRISYIKIRKFGKKEHKILKFC